MKMERNRREPPLLSPPPPPLLPFFFFFYPRSVSDACLETMRAREVRCIEMWGNNRQQLEAGGGVAEVGVGVGGRTDCCCCAMKRSPVGGTEDSTRRFERKRN